MPQSQDTETAATPADLSNWRKSPHSRWAFHHVDDLMPTMPIAAPEGRAWALPIADSGRLANFQLSVAADRSLSLDQVLQATATDAFMVLHDGRVVHESYADAGAPDTRHILMSATKSVVGLIAGILQSHGSLDADVAVSRILPEVAHTAYRDATVRQLLDMRTGIRLAPGEQAAYARASGWEPVPAGVPGADMHGFFERFETEFKPHGGAFAYVSANTDLLGWVIERVTGRPFAALASELLWKPMGAERDAFITTDSHGAPRCTGGLCATLRDFARVGQLMVEHGTRGSTQVVPSSLIDDIAAGGDRDAWKEGEFFAAFGGRAMSYRSGWYVVHAEPTLMFAMGIHGQQLFVDLADKLVVAKFSSQELATDPRAIGLTSMAVAEIRRCLS
ncbi:MAG: putative beta-lactamase family protein [Rhizobacter sp.]|nr:putative beta-lactamase family protein [Rhizobacter sp.]